LKKNDVLISNFFKIYRGCIEKFKKYEVC